jgi:hypothetical protein
MRRVFTISLLLVPLFVAACASERPALVPRDEALMDLAFLTGAWVTDIENGRRTEELWTTPDGGTMLGVSRTIAIGDDEENDRRTVAFEFLRIEHTGDDEIIYYAAPAGRDPPTPFTLIQRSPTRFVFENPEHDFPRRIIYEQQRDGLLLRIEGVENGEAKSSAWFLRRARLFSGLTEQERWEREARRRERWEQLEEDSFLYHRFYDYR